MGDYVPDADLQHVLDSLANDKPTVSNSAVTPSPCKASGNAVTNQSDVLKENMFLTKERIRLPTNGPIQQRKRNSTNNTVFATVPARRKCIGFTIVYGDQGTVWVYSIDLDGPLIGTPLKQGMVLKSVNDTECSSYQSFVQLIQQLESKRVKIEAYSPTEEVLMEQERYHMKHMPSQPLPNPYRYHLERKAVQDNPIAYDHMEAQRLVGSKDVDKGKEDEVKKDDDTTKQPVPFPEKVRNLFVRYVLY